MLFSSWLRNLKRSAPAARRRTQTSSRQRTSFCLALEALEDRSLPSGLPYPTAATVSQLITDIKYANTTGGAFTINLKPSTAFDLEKVNNTTNGANALPVVGGTKAVNLTILGNGDTIERVGSKAFRLFDVSAGSSLTLDHLTLQGGWAYDSRVWWGVGSDGGAIYNQGTLTVRNGSTLSGNTANNEGGGIYNAGGTVTVSNGSTLSHNTAYSGGGIYNAGGTVTVSNSTLSGNTANYEGGGIDNDGGAVTVSSSTLSGNSAGSFGGGIYNSPHDFGGGVYNDGTLTVSGSTVSLNTAIEAGGGILNQGTATFTSSAISSNSAGSPPRSLPLFLGGGIYNSGTLTLSGCTVSGNFAASAGGGIYNLGTLTVENSSSITGNTILADTASGYAAEDVYNAGMVYMLYLDSISMIGVLDIAPAYDQAGG
jgi:hypothetical protein